MTGTRGSPSRRRSVGQSSSGVKWAAMGYFRSRRQTHIAPSPQFVIAWVGLAFEARIAANPDVLVLCGKAGREHVAPVNASVVKGCRAIVSFGVAGGLAPNLRPGDLIVASAVQDLQTVHRTDAVWSDKLLSAMPAASYAPIVGVDAPVVCPRAKRELNTRTGAVAVDMESHLVARFAAARGLAFVAIRVVIDPADRSVPPAALAGMRPDGRTSIAAVLSELIADPSQTKALARIAIDLYAARNSLLRVRRLLGHGFGHSDPDDANSAYCSEAAGVDPQTIPG